MEEKEIRIPGTTAGLMIAVGLLFDGGQAIANLVPVLGQVVSYLSMICVFMTFNILWFHWRGIKFFESLIGKGGRALVKWALCAFFEVITAGIFPGVTVWLILTILQVRFDDMLVAKKIVTREELQLIDATVRQIYRRHGVDSPEFRQAVAGALGKEIENRLDNIKNHRAQAISQNRIVKTLDNVAKNSPRIVPPRYRGNIEDLDSAV